ncbi:thialysine N-epsilon-acetyltransferase isoform X1 [Prionailurus iriomotensis]
MAMASVRIRQAEEGDCGNILKLIRGTSRVRETLRPGEDQ